MVCFCPTFPYTKAEAKKVKEQLVAAQEAETAWSKKKKASPSAAAPPLIHPAQNLVKFTLVPIPKAGLEAMPPRSFLADAAREGLDVPAMRQMVTKAEVQRVRTIAAAAAMTTTTTTVEKGDDFVVPSVLEAMKEGDAEIVFLGTGSSMPAKYRNVTGMLLDQPEFGSMFLDVGEGSYGQLRRCLGQSGADEALKRLRCVWISHIHADHHVGLARVLTARRALLGEGKMMRSTLRKIRPRPVPCPAMMKKYPRFRMASAHEAQKDIMVEFLRLSQLFGTQQPKRSNPNSSNPSIFSVASTSSIVRRLNAPYNEEVTPRRRCS